MIQAEAPILAPDGSAYERGPERFERLTRAIEAVWPVKKSWDKGEEMDDRASAAVANAAERGQRIDRYCCEFAEFGSVKTDDDEREDVLQGVEAFARWWDATKAEFVSAQETLYDEDAGIAGTLDLKLRIDGLATIIDIKRTWAVERTHWMLQLGGLIYMDHRSIVHKCAVLHLGPKFAGGYKWREYDAIACMEAWGEVRAVWMRAKTL